MEEIRCPGQDLGLLAEILSKEIFKIATTIPNKQDIIEDFSSFPEMSSDNLEYSLLQAQSRYDKYEENRTALSLFTDLELSDLNKPEYSDLRTSLRGYIVAHSYRCPNCKETKEEFLREQVKGLKIDKEYSIERAKKRLEKLYFGVPCPGKKIMDLLNSLDKNVFDGIVKAAQLRDYKVLKIGIESNFPVITPELRDKLYLQKRKENINRKELYKRILEYSYYVEEPGEMFLDFSIGLGLHVEHCTHFNGSCFGNYMIWLEEKANEIVKKENRKEKEIPGIIRRLDIKYLNIINL